MKKVIITLLCFMALIFLGCKDDKTYTVTWKNINGEVLEIDENVPKNTMASYDGKTPTYELDSEAGFQIVFDGWDKEITKVTCDIIYTATYKKVESGEKVNPMDILHISPIWDDVSE